MATIRLYTDEDYDYASSSKTADSCLYGCYFHGLAEEALGDDIIFVSRADAFMEEGVHDFEVLDTLTGLQIISGKLFVWHVSGDRQRGLAVISGDSVGMRYARCCYNNHQVDL